MNGKICRRPFCKKYTYSFFRICLIGGVEKWKGKKMRNDKKKF